MKDASRKQCLEDFVLLMMDLSGASGAARADIQALLSQTSLPVDWKHSNDLSLLVSACFTFTTKWISLIDNGTDQPLVAFTNVNPSDQRNVICGVLGCSLPLVVRQDKDEDRILGSCMILGYRHGEAMEELRNGKWELRTFRFI